MSASFPLKETKLSNTHSSKKVIIVSKPHNDSGETLIAKLPAPNFGKSASSFPKFSSSSRSDFLVIAIAAAFGGLGNKVEN